MSAKRIQTAFLAFALTAPAHATIEDLSTWDFYRDPDPGPGALQDAMTGSSASNLAQLNFINDVDVPAAYDIGYSSINANTIGEATSGYYFSTANDFTIRMHFTLDLTNPDGLVGLGLGIGEDRAGVSSVGVGFAVPTISNVSVPGYAGARTDFNGRHISNLGIAVPAASSYSGSLTVAYDATTGDVTVGAATGLGSPDPLAPTNTVTFTAGQFSDWNGDDKLLVSFFLRSDNVGLPPVDPWSGDSAQADFFDFTVVQGSAIAVPEPSSLALLGLSGLLIARRRRR